MPRKLAVPSRKLKLAPHLVPKPLWGKSASQVFGRRALWKRIRTDALIAANHACQVCSDAPSPIYGDPLICHEIWDYDDKRWTATLSGFRIQCNKCNSAVHMGMAVAYGARDAAIDQLRKVNDISTEEAEELYRDAMAMWKKRSQKKWRLAISKSVLEQYPQLAELMESV
jgi:hypothetical protein